MSCNEKIMHSCERRCEDSKGGSGFVIIVVLYILLVVILGTRTAYY